MPYGPPNAVGYRHLRAPPSFSNAARMSGHLSPVAVRGERHAVFANSWGDRLATRPPLPTCPITMRVRSRAVRPVMLMRRRSALMPTTVRPLPQFAA
jgi:hypothetical protein